MSERLAVIQSDVTVKEINEIDNNVQKLVSSFNSLLSITDAVNKSFQTGKPKDYANGLKQAKTLAQELANVEKELASVKLKLAQIETQETKTIVEQYKARKEAANAATAEARTERQQQIQSQASASAYQKVSQEANKLKRQAKDLEAEILLLTRDFKTGVISQERYNQELGKLQSQFSQVVGKARQLDSELKRIDANVGDRQRNVGNYQQSALSGVKQLESQIKSMITMYVGFQAVVTGAGKLMHNNYELSDALVDLQIRLNGNKQAADELFESLKQIDTRTSLGELVNTASLVAKKGVAKDEIEGITKALDDYFIVAGKEAGNREEGTASIIKLISIFNEDKHITAERVTEISTALVKLQNSGVATGARMIDVAERIGAIRGLTGVTLPQVLGFAAAIEQLGQKSEVAGTAGMQILTKILSDMPKYAKLANVSVKELRKAYSENPFEAVVMVAEGVLKSGDFERISQDLEEVGVRGARVKGVLGDIAGNADFVRKRIKDAGLAINQTGYLSETAALKQETYAATVDKIKKEFELIGDSKGFMNFLKGSSNLLMNFIKLITAIPFSVVITGITLMTAAWAYYKGVAIQAAIATAWNNSESLLGIVRNTAAKLGLVSETAARRAQTAAIQADTLARNVNIASLENQIVQERFAIASIQSQIVTTEAEMIAKRQQIATREAHIVALEAEIIATREAAVAQAALNTTTKASPLGVILGLLALAIPLLITYADKTDKVAIKTRTAADNQKDLNDAMSKGAKNAGDEAFEMDNLYRKATDANGAIKDKQAAVKQLQEQFPSYFGQINEEIIMNGKAEASYIKLKNAIVASARAEAIKDKLKGRESERLSKEELLRRELDQELENRKKYKLQADLGLDETSTIDNGDGKEIFIKKDSKKLYEASTIRAYNIIKTLNDNRKNYRKEDKILLDQMEIDLKNSEKYREDRANMLGKFAKNGDDEKEKKEKAYTGAKYTGEQKDYIMRLESVRDKELSINEKKYIDGELSLKEYLEKSKNLNISYLDDKIKYLKGANAKEESEISKAELEKAKITRDTQKKIFEIDSKNLEENFKMRSNTLERQSKDLEKSDYLTDFDKLNNLIQLDSQMLSETSSFYEKQIELAQNAAQETVELERKRDEEIGKIEDQRYDRIKSITEAVKKDIETRSSYDKTFGSISQEEQKAVILNNKKLTIAEREYRLSVLEKNNQIEVNKLELKRLELLSDQLSTKIAINQNGFATPADFKEAADLKAQIEAIKNEIKELNLEIIETLSPKDNATKDVIMGGLKDLGFDHVSDQFGVMFDKIKQQTADWKDYSLLAASAVLEGLSMLSQHQKEKTIADLDEQLKKSQEVTDQEVGFINSRLDALNAMGDLTAEQITERNRLEDEARVYQDQQREREKLIETQKAKAEQKAAAQQALINGALAATMTLGQMGFIAGAIPAGLALAFGIAQSIAIMSKDPVPKYWTGRKGGKAEFAITQDRGREIIAGEDGRIKSLGSDSGDKMTWLDKGDTVYTANETKSILKSLGPDAQVGKKLFRNIAQKSLIAPQMTVLMKTVDNSDAIAEKLGKKIDQSFAKYTHPTIEKRNGMIIRYRGSQNGEVIGEYDNNGNETYYS
ncbi:phage tail tape measure protein [Chryseobacterium sp. JK1]|uniref:phage tail tape measure protein n=1 Tax=Chryseobacterium sp. JK1 TaxID=874294 RepID=UPI003D689CA0